MMNEPDDVRELLAAYALNAVDDLDRARVEELLARDPSARRELARFEAAVAALHDDNDAIAPPLEAWDAIRTRIAGTKRRTTQRTRFRWIAAAAAALLVVIGTVIVVTQLRDDNDRVGQLSAALNDPNAGTGTLTGEGVQAPIAVDPDGDGFLDARTLPALPPGKVYQLWNLDGATPASLGVLQATDGVATFKAPTTSHTLALSVENSPGAAQPTLPPAAVVELTPIRPRGA